MIALDRTLATDSESVYTLVPLMVRTLSPLHQGTFNETIRGTRLNGYKENFSPIRTVEWYDETSGWMEIPVVSGNSLRGRLRRYTAQILFRRLIRYGNPNHPSVALVHKLLDPNVLLTDKEREILKLFLSGGTLKAKKSEDSSATTEESSANTPAATRPDASETPAANTPQMVWALREPLDRTQLEYLFPMLPLFGYANGDIKMRPGALAVTDLIPLFTETASLLRQWDGVGALIHPSQATPSWNKLLESRNQKWPVTAVVRSDPMNGRATSLADANAVDEDKAKTQMFVMNEYMPPGQTLLGGLYVHDSLTAVERGLLYTALDTLMADGFLGGGRSRGYGHVQWSPQPIAKVRDDQAAWEAHVQRNVPAMLDQLGDLYEIRQSAAKPKPAATKKKKKK